METLKDYCVLQFQAIIVEHATKRLMESRSREDAEIGLRPQTSEAVPSDPTSPYASSNIVTYESPNVAHEDDYSPQPHLSESSVLQQIPSTSFPSNQPLPSTSQPPSFKYAQISCISSTPLS
ncbi:unnamed protein product [Schistocephalus solidus]|uniref:Ras-specific guanine nucleotide-releasing factor RalGPS1 n=1 Tax=Schistocephalus solidus TaxID=70667 RepID=A0A183SDQ6_SCHSO|nr:unnamed protein product [Schistocephalus solidus]